MIAVSLGFGLIPIVQPQFFRALPEVLQPILRDPILLTAIAAIVLNALLGTTSSRAEPDGSGGTAIEGAVDGRNQAESDGSDSGIGSPGSTIAASSRSSRS
ncbi:hypothetical protein AEGHOMDF_2581 [Methylobacterium soli]|nr:hypothetical protein AEGHOMDF_2581 [Methylobacterium soli]